MSAETENAEKRLDFEGTAEIRGEKAALWAFISDPENLVDCVPGAQDIERVSEREYDFVIEQEIGFFSAVFDGESELVEMNEPEWILAEGSAYDRTTGSTFEVLAGMEMADAGGDAIELAYTAEVTFTGGVANHAARFVRRVIDAKVDEYFDNVRTAFEDEVRAGGAATFE